MNALWMPKIGPNVRILLLNNGCGGIFSAIGAPESPLVNAPHRATAEAWVRSCGFGYHAARNVAELAEGIAYLLQESTSEPLVLEVFTNARQDAELLKKFYDTASE